MIDINYINRTESSTRIFCIGNYSQLLYGWDSVVNNKIRNKKLFLKNKSKKNIK